MIVWTPAAQAGGFGLPPFIFPPKDLNGDISRIWADSWGNLFVGTVKDNFYFIKEGADLKSWDFDVKLDSDSNLIIPRGAKEVKKIIIENGVGVNAFAQDLKRSSIVLIATTKGLIEFDLTKLKLTPLKITGKYDPFTATELMPERNGDIWFGTKEKGIGYYNSSKQSVEFFTYPAKERNKRSFPIRTLCRKSKDEFFVAVADSLPAIFNKQTRSFRFFTDSVFQYSKNETTDIDLDPIGNLYLIKGGALYMAKISENEDLASTIPIDSSLLAPMIQSIEDIRGYELASRSLNEEMLKKITLPYNKNSLIIRYDISDLGEKDSIKFAWRIKGYTYDWIYPPVVNVDSAFAIFLYDLKPGKYLFELKARVGNEDWRKQQAELIIIITPPVWKKWWFWILIPGAVFGIIYLIIKWRVRNVRKHEREKARHEKELLELEARSLRAQMNPHFVFNCLNSIKALIQNDEKQKSVDYLTTFCKLIRTLFNNSDKRQVSLYDEIETCQLYTHLEAMRLEGKLDYQFDIDKNIDLKSVMVPALIIQPFIENAIWHGIVPKEKGKVWVRVFGEDQFVVCEIEDNGIGREVSRKNKPATPVLHQSKGINLSQARLNLEKILTDKSATIEIIDKYEENIATGTKVIIKFSIQ